LIEHCKLYLINLRTEFNNNSHVFLGLLTEFLVDILSEIEEAVLIVTDCAHEEQRGDVGRQVVGVRGRQQEGGDLFAMPPEGLPDFVQGRETEVALLLVQVVEEEVRSVHQSVGGVVFGFEWRKHTRELRLNFGLICHERREHF